MSKLIAKPLEIEGVVLITPTRFEDHRGYFQETFNAEEFSQAVGAWVEFVQDNESKSNEKGTIRGLHYQLDPFAQGKLVRVLQGSLVDVVVDIRRSSPTYKKHLSVELNAEQGQQLWVPPGMAHGFCTQEPETVLSYKVTNYYDATSDRSILWNDPELGINWPTVANPVLSEKDAKAPNFLAAEESGDVFE